MKIKHNKTSVILGEIPREEILLRLEERKDNIRHEGRKYSIERMKVFQLHGCRCYFCGVEGTKVIMTKDAGEGLHCDLYAVTPSGFLLMNRDHILPASLGGKNNVWNMRPTCYNCNQKRGNNFSYEDRRLLRRRAVMGAIYRFFRSYRRRRARMSHEWAYRLSGWVSVIIP